MYNEEKKVTIEWVKEEKQKSSINLFGNKKVSNPICKNPSDNSSLSNMVTTILDNELPMLKNNSLLHDLVLYSLLEKMKTVQTVENVLSYIKENNAKKVQDVCFKNGEVRIKCST